MLSTNNSPDFPDERTSFAFPVDLRKSYGRKKVRKDRAKAYRYRKKFKDKLQKNENDIKKYRKRLLRGKAKYTRNATDSPSTKTKKLLRGQSISKEVKRMLNFHHAIIKGLREK